VGRHSYDETGNRYGRLLVSFRSSEVEKSDAVWVCRCDCGNVVQVKGHHLRREHGTRSCGCLRREQAAERIRQVAKGKFGEQHPQWKGENVGYGALHIWLRAHKPKTGVCENCGQARYTEYSMPHDGITRNLDDYEELCKPCHMRKDGHPWIGHK